MVDAHVDDVHVEKLPQEREVENPPFVFHHINEEKVALTPQDVC